MLHSERNLTVTWTQAKRHLKWRQHVIASVPRVMITPVLWMAWSFDWRKGLKRKKSPTTRKREKYVHRSKSTRDDAVKWVYPRRLVCESIALTPVFTLVFMSATRKTRAFLLPRLPTAKENRKTTTWNIARRVEEWMELEFVSCGGGASVSTPLKETAGDGGVRALIIFWMNASQFVSLIFPV